MALFHADQCYPGLPPIGRLQPIVNVILPYRNQPRISNPGSSCPDWKLTNEDRTQDHHRHFPFHDARYDCRVGAAEADDGLRAGQWAQDVLRSPRQRRTGGAAFPIPLRSISLRRDLKGTARLNFPPLDCPAHLAITSYTWKSDLIGGSRPSSFAFRTSSNPRLWPSRNSGEPVQPSKSSPDRQKLTIR